jgi:hypothetical protein
MHQALMVDSDSPVEVRIARIQAEVAHVSDLGRPHHA